MKWRLDEPKHEFARASLAPAVLTIAAMAPARPGRWRKLRAELHRIRKILPKMKSPRSSSPLISDHPVDSRSFIHGLVAAYLASNGNECRSQPAPSAFRVCSKLNFLARCRASQLMALLRLANRR